jgi:hypothetical protein
MVDARSKQGVVVEVDGPRHFCRSVQSTPNQRALGGTLYKRRLLESQGWKVVTVPYYEWLALDDDQHAQKNYLRAKIGPLQ